MLYCDSLIIDDTVIRKESQRRLEKRLEDSTTDINS